MRATAADGNTLLHAASDAEDVEFVRFLLSKGLDPPARNNGGTTPLGMTYSEEVSMILLEAGSDPGLMESKNFSYRSFVQANGWFRVIAWLDWRGK